MGSVSGIPRCSTAFGSAAFWMGEFEIAWVVRKGRGKLGFCGEGKGKKRKLYVLDEALPDKEPEAGATKAQKDAYSKHYSECIDVTCLMLACKNSELQKQFEEMDAFTNIGQLMAMFQELGLEINRELAIDLVVQSLLNTFNQFVMSYNMHKKEKSLNKLHGMLKTAELNIKSTSEDLMVRKGKNPKKREQYQGTGKGKATVKASKLML
ncbi:Retrovirus-related Pol polyprotein from transposon TNT 1-94 [Cucumis melo var. makuwa]|uniref:Retrovirus-related Pol polyprotein from transposon TNT 1-94 n=1 Tax=Cucumis melo var. makuwa TaxID=1194695 RepID=A0A5D3BSK1_CUCMM|nr:Retrovirus-related Pol polyprotein from transposon TNT 1-94 [Cucumis melo var. makuwa]